MGKIEARTLHGKIRQWGVLMKKGKNAIQYIYIRTKLKC